MKFFSTKHHNLFDGDSDGDGDVDGDSDGDGYGDVKAGVVGDVDEYGDGGGDGDDGEETVVEKGSKTETVTEI